MQPTTSILSSPSWLCCAAKNAASPRRRPGGLGERGGAGFCGLLLAQHVRRQRVSSTVGGYCCGRAWTARCLFCFCFCVSAAPRLTATLRHTRHWGMVLPLSSPLPILPRPSPGCPRAAVARPFPTGVWLVHDSHAGDERRLGVAGYVGTLPLARRAPLWGQRQHRPGRRRRGDAQQADRPAGVHYQAHWRAGKRSNPRPPRAWCLFFIEACVSLCTAAVWTSMRR